MHDELMALAEKLTGLGERPAPVPLDPVNAPMIRNWQQALGEKGSWEAEAPPAMLQVWSMPGLVDTKAGSAADEILQKLNAGGFTGVVAVNCEHAYDRPIRIGERLRSTMRFGGIAGPKRTAMGEGYFVTWHQAWYSGDERVGEMLFRVLKFLPVKRRPAGKPILPAIGLDTEFFWAGAREGELRIQKCGECGVLRHPPGPMCPSCHATKRDFVVASGRGTVYSHVVHHHPPVPGRTPPYVVALVELEEGPRIIGNLLDIAPEDVTVGMPVQLTFQQISDDVTLPQWQPAGTPPPAPRAVRETRSDWDALELPLTPTLIVATAIATRDFTPVHHDVALARAQGSKDIFLNILTTMGLVQRYVLENNPGASVAGIKVRLGAPAYAGDTLTLTGTREGDVVTVRGAVSLGDHVNATVTLR
ncbi:OB-fold domain-containing protein [Actinocorallia longicatena]|uniref:OB-fold protein n=1 Tax=Actinocorallia longicatena TaxID=111803 RepID=A0ABP6Q037_9ACTN